MESCDIEEEMWLLGQPPLKDFLRFLEREAIGQGGAELSSLAEQWRAAGRLYQSLEASEAGIGNEAGRHPLPPALHGAAEELQAHPWFRRSFDQLPTTLAWVELDRLIVHQKRASRTYVEALRARFDDPADPAALFRFCLPLEAAPAPVRMRRIEPRRYSFTCDSIDFRFLEATLLDPRQLGAHEGYGPAAAVLALLVGFGSNFLNAIAVGRRLVLNNGHHRALALRGLGVTHAPCVVQTASTLDDLELVADRDVLRNPGFYLESARPPLLGDFFDPRIARAFRVRRRLRLVEVSFEVKDHLVEA